MSSSKSLILPLLLLVSGLVVAVSALFWMQGEPEGFGPLVVPEGASPVTVIEDELPGLKISYQVGEFFPAYGFVAQIARHHIDAGWSQESGLLFLTLEDSLDADWDDFVDSMATPPVRRRERMFEFGSPIGERALYFLTYETPPGVEETPVLLNVRAAYYTPEEVIEAQRQFGLVDPIGMRATPLRPIPPKAEDDAIDVEPSADAPPPGELPSAEPPQVDQ